MNTSNNRNLKINSAKDKTPSQREKLKSSNKQNFYCL